ncbi:hypothetical protein CC78DRAFT_621695 [Lojkania enalia]|uniref:Uncharacterized protein n=1 Tax=Lojkania enalia TaxID=147567 RepID=A0A9P4N1C6_9PLEO|nr:hypothetical protein CC78DRAFT_621695 [Didymosphaeria enalia]
MTGEKRGADLSARLKRPSKLTSRDSKATSPSRITAPPKAAIASSSKTKKDNLHRRKNPFNDMLLHKSGKETTNSNSTSTPEEAEQVSQDQQHVRASSIGSIKSITGARAADRIAELERNLVVAQEEQNVLQEELDKVRQHGVVYRETIEDYRRQLSVVYSNSHNHNSQSCSESPLEIDYEQEAPPRRSFNRPDEDLLEHNYELRTKIAELQDQLIEQDSIYRTRLDQQLSSRHHEYNDLQNRLHNTEKESQERLQQLLSLKHSISALTRMETQVTDSDLTDKFDNLYHRVREWVIGSFRRTKLSFANISPATAIALERITTHPQKIDTTDRLSFYQAIVSSHIVHSIFSEDIYVGLPSSGPLASIRQTAFHIHSGSPEYQEWRRTTTRALDSSSAKQQLHTERHKLLLDICSQIQRCLVDLTGHQLVASASASLVTVLETAVEVQHTLLLQKAQYKVLFFRNKEGMDVYFDEAQMEDINIDEDIDDDAAFPERKLRFCVFPCLEKFGDEVGENLEVCNVLLKARVCCGVG